MRDNKKKRLIAERQKAAKEGLDILERVTTYLVETYHVHKPADAKDKLLQKIRPKLAEEAEGILAERKWRWADLHSAYSLLRSLAHAINVHEYYAKDLHPVAYSFGYTQHENDAWDGKRKVQYWHTKAHTAKGVKQYG